MSCGVGCRLGSDPSLLWLWHRPVVTALIRPLAWEPPYAAEVALEMAKRQKKKKKKTTIDFIKHITFDLLILLLRPLATPGHKHGDVWSGIFFPILLEQREAINSLD